MCRTVFRVAFHCFSNFAHTYQNKSFSSSCMPNSLHLDRTIKRNNETNNGMGQYLIMMIVIIFSNTTQPHTPYAARRTPHADERSLATKRQKVIKGSSRLRVCQLIPSHNPLTSILSLSPASSPSCPEPPSSRQEIYLDNSQDFIYPLVVRINEHDGE